jgi:hypothetical protein
VSIGVGQPPALRNYFTVRTAPTYVYYRVTLLSEYTNQSISLYSDRLHIPLPAFVLLLFYEIDVERTPFVESYS